MSALLRTLPAEVVDLLHTGRGVFTLADASSVDVSAGRVERLARAGMLERVGRGVFASRRQLATAEPWVAYAIRTHGFVRACRSPTFAAGWSAIAIRSLPCLVPPPPRPVAVQPQVGDSGSTRTRYGVIRTTPLDPQSHARYAGCPVVGNAWMVVDLARHAPRVDALVIADTVLARGTTKAGLRRALAGMRGWRDTAAAAWVVAHANGGAESALETLGRFCCLEHGLPVPLSNVWVGPGYPLYRVDHLWPEHGVAAEADGALKYRDASDPALVVANEKERQWRLQRDVGLDVIRYDWAPRGPPPRSARGAVPPCARRQPPPG